MESRTFDRMSRLLGSGASRRSVLRGLLGAATGGAAALAGRETLARGRTMEICHRTWAWSTDWRIITVNANDERRIQAHLDHGDTVNPDFNYDPDNCGGCGNVCEAPENAYGYCSGGGCFFACNGGYEWNGSACVELAPPTCPSFSTPDGLCYHQEYDSNSGQWCWFPAGPEWGISSESQCVDANWDCGSGGGCWSWRTSAP